jgi:hypothetical protein
MPKYAERDRVRPIPGAFGKERTKEDWARVSPRAQHLAQRGIYEDYLYVLVEEEYGFLTFLWVYPGTAKELVDDWCDGVVPWRSWKGRHWRGEFDPVHFMRPKEFYGKPYNGPLELSLVETQEVFEGRGCFEDFDGHAHYHEEDDSYLKVGFYEVNGVMNPMVTFHALDALVAAIS